MASSSSINESRGSQVVVIGVLFTVLAAALAVSRLFTRFIILRSLGGDDILISLGLVTSITLTALTIKQVDYGLGKHYASLPPEVVMENLKTLWTSIIIYYISLAIVKISIIVQYLRIFVDKRMRMTCWIILAIVSAYSVTTIFGAVFTCYPVRYFWDKTSTESSSCLNQKALWFSNASLNILTDLVILICPMPALNSLQLPRRQKIGVMFVFALGGVTCIMSILRLHSLYVISISTDPTWDNVGAATWSMVELNTGITCACLPMLKPLVSRLFPRLLGTSNNASTRDQNLETGGTYARQKNNTSKSTSTPRISVYMQGVERGMRHDVSIAGKQGQGNRNAHGKDIQVTTVVEVAHQAEDEEYHARDGSISASERNLVLPLQKL